MAGNGASWWAKWAPVLGATIVSGGTIIAFFVQIGNMQNAIQALQADRAQHERRLSDIEAIGQRLKESEADSCQQFAKVETQFGTVETVINELRVDDLRTRGVIWPKLFQQTYPPTFYEIKIPHELQACNH